MDKSTNQSSLWLQLEQIVENLKSRRLADVFRFVSFYPGETYGPHSHLRIEINYVKRGRCSLKLKDETFGFREGELMIISPNVDHFFEAGPEGATLMQLEFLPEIFSNFNWADNTIESPTVMPSPFSVFSEPNGLIKIVNNILIVRVVQRIVDELETRSPYYKYMVVMLYAELLIHIYRYVSETYLPTCSNEVLKKATLFMRHNYQQSISITALAQQLGIGERYLRSLFSHHLHMSPINYLNQIRINKAVELLRNTDLSVKEIGFRCGFQSPQYFSRLFKQYMGVTPHQLTRE